MSKKNLISTASEHIIICFAPSKLESEIIHVQHSQTWTVKMAYPQPNYAAWIQDIQPRLQEWYMTIPQPSKAHSLLLSSLARRIGILSITTPFSCFTGQTL